MSRNNIDEVRKWVDKNYIDDKEKIIRNELLNIKNSIEKCNVVTLIFNSAEKCNLKCKYCFANEGTYNNMSTKKMMTLDDYIKVYKVINADNQLLAIEFFGGEPLLNYPIIKEFCEYVRCDRKNKNQPIPQFGIITNGTLINSEIWEFFKEFSFHTTISLDGPKEINDINRCYKNGKGSFDDIIKNIRSNMINDECMFDACEATLSCDILNQMSEEDIWEYINFFDKLPCKAIAILFAIDEKSQEYAENSDFVEKLNQFYSIYIEYCISHIMAGELINYHTDIINAIRAFMVGGEISFCKAGVKQIFVNVKGEIYPCQRYYGTNQKMGHIADYGAAKKKMMSYKRDYASRINTDCLICEYRYMCEGAACPGSNLVVNGAESKYLKLMCIVNKVRNTQVLHKLFEILMDSSLKKSFLTKYAEYLKNIEEDKDETTIFE